MPTPPDHNVDTTTTAHDQLAEETICLLRDVLRGARMARPRAWIGLDLTVAQLRVLMALTHGGAMSVGHLADWLGVRQPTASHLIDRLVRGGLVARAEDPADRRRMLVHVTPAGEQLVGQLMGFVGLLRSGIQQLDDQDLLALRQGLQALSQTVAAASASTPETCDEIREER